MRLERVAVVGVGLIGGSFALALKQAKACARVVGVGRSPANLKQALERGVIDVIESDAGAAARGAQLVLIAAPVAQFPSILKSLARELAPGTVITDAGSTKRDVVDAARKALGAKSAQFVPAHPIAGAEKSGAGAAHAELFRGRRVVLTPLAENTPAHLDLVRAAWATCGARLSEMDPDEHDAVLATVSHLPHLLAYALVHEVAQRGNAQQLFSYAAGGFRDFTRIASSHPEMWRDICLANRQRIEEELSRFSMKLNDVKKLLADPPGLEKLFAEARAARQRWLEGKFEA
jgi:prephenate dehydrogenase